MTTPYDERELYFYFQGQEKPATEIPATIERISDWSSYYADKKQNKLYVWKKD
jgi:hypothetical protein